MRPTVDAVLAIRRYPGAHAANPVHLWEQPEIHQMPNSLEPLCGGERMRRDQMKLTRAVLTRKLAFSVLAGAGVLSTMLLPCQALAQDPVPEGGSEASSTSSDGKARTSGKKRISLDDEFLVEGKLEKPSAFFVFKRSAVDYDWARLDALFAPLVLESVQDPLF
jgi:hypothetical protein